MSDNQNDENIRNLREKAERADAAEQRAADLERKVVFYEAGVDPTSPLGELLFQSFDGTAVELKEKATTLGYFTPATAPGTEPKFEAAETQQQALRQTLSGGMAPVPGTDLGPDPWENGFSAFHESMRQGVPREDAQIDLLAKIVKAGTGPSTDPRVGWNPRRYYQEADRLAAAESGN